MGALMHDLNARLDVHRYFPIPLHRARMKERGFNQSELLLHSAGWSPAGEGLARIRKTERQVGRHLGERRMNMAGAFSYRGPRLDGLAVALVDDVVTTGATVAECAVVLKDAGARSVWALAFARASYHPELGPEEPTED
jgi:ComF family protein